MESTSKNFFETITNMQKQVADNFTEASEKFQKNVTTPNFIDSDFFKKWYDSQMSFFTQGNNKTNEENPLNFFNNWLTSQMELSNNLTNKMKQDFTQMSEDNKSKFGVDNDMFNNWMSTVNNTYNEMTKSFTNTDAKNSFAGLFNNSQNYMKMFEIWMPMLKSIQNRSYTPDTFKSMFNQMAFKSMMDGMFNMQPDYMKNMMDSMTSSSKDQFAKMNEQAKSFMDNMKNSMGNVNGNEFFDKMTAMYKSNTSNLDNAIAPFMKLMTPNADTKQMDMMKEMSNEFNMYNMMNAKMQYMMYVTGNKAMEEMGTNVYAKMVNGEDMGTFSNIYQEWLNVADKNFVSLFDSEEYSKMQSELNSFGMKLKRNVNLSMEKALEKLPLINRTEMDELYKTIYDLKKKITALEKANKTTVASAKPVAKAEVVADAKSDIKSDTKTATKKSTTKKA
jgi:polyhydroxyalkanoate synthase subunit PhaE